MTHKTNEIYVITKVSFTNDLALCDRFPAAETIISNMSVLCPPCTLQQTLLLCSVVTAAHSRVQVWGGMYSQPKEIDAWHYMVSAFSYVRRSFVGVQVSTASQKPDSVTFHA